MCMIINFQLNDIHNKTICDSASLLALVQLQHRRFGINLSVLPVQAYNNMAGR